MNRSSRLKGKLVLITGASKGLGRQLALDYAREGAAGLCLVARHGDQLNGVRDEIQKLSSKTKVITVSADVGREEDIERIVALAMNEFHGRLDVLVNNASELGPSPMPLLLDYPLNEFRRVIDVNLVGPFVLIRKLLPAMMEGGGSIINVTSDAGVVGYSNWGAYGISKSALEGLSRTWAAELEGTGVRVNLVDPGNMNTDMHRAAEPEEDPTEWADPADVTDVFVYLASDESRGLHGKRFEAQKFVKRRVKVIAARRR